MVGRKYARMLTMRTSRWQDYGFSCFFFPLVLCTILYFPGSVQISTGKLYKWKNRRRAVFSQFFIVNISCDNSEEKPLPYFKGTIKSMTIQGDRMRHRKRQQQELQWWELSGLRRGPSLCLGSGTSSLSSLSPYEAKRLNQMTFQVSYSTNVLWFGFTAHFSHGRDSTEHWREMGTN